MKIVLVRENGAICRALIAAGWTIISIRQGWAKLQLTNGEGV